MEAHSTFSQIHLGVPFPPCAGAWETLLPQLAAAGVADAPAPVPGPTPTSQAQEGPQAMSGFLSAASGPPSPCCSGGCPYPALLCAPELPQVGGTTQGAPLSRVPVGLSQWRPEVGRSQKQGCLSPHSSWGLSAVLGVAAFLSSQGLQQH